MVYIHSGPGFEALKDHINKEYRTGNFAEEWRNLPEVPGKNEIWSKIDPQKEIPVTERWNDYQKDPDYSNSLPHNIIDGSWPSKAKYLGAHYQIIREDEIAPLRKSVASFKTHPDMMEDDETHIYTHVTFKGIKFSPIGLAFRVEFSTERAGKQIRWEQSKRLMQGTMVAISSHRDCFRTSCKVAIIAARPLIGGVDQNPPQVDIFFGDRNDVVFDPDEQYVMVEARTGYFEASRHMLVAIQKLMNEKFSLAKHIVELDPNVKAPEYIEEHSIYDFSPLLPEESAQSEPDDRTRREGLYNIDILEDFPDVPESGMDPSQLLAFENMMKKKVAIVQGPPGTGKTFVSVSALKVMLANLQPGEPPIIVSAQTNHALDQLLNHVLKFEPHILRLGSRCDKSNKQILERTLYQLKQSELRKQVPEMYQGIKPTIKEHEAEVDAIKEMLQPLLQHSLVTAETFLKWGVICQEHYDSLYSDPWAGQESNNNLVGLESWLPPDQVVPIAMTPQNDSTLPMEEGEIEQEVVSALDQEARPADHEDDKDALSGEYLQFGRRWTGRNTGIPDDEILKLLKRHKHDLHGVPVVKRGDTYRWMLKRLGEKLRRKMKSRLEEYSNVTNKLRLMKWSANSHFIRKTGIKLVGCTTTGLSKYRGLLAALEPRTLLIEEAAETKEGTIIAGMIESLQHLILVGDHQQLQANCNIKALEDAPYHMNVSMFERLVKNSIGYVMLNKQRRMVPNIRKLLTIEPAPFYRNLQDHNSVLDRQVNRPLVPGMGDRDVWFFSHNWPEGRNPDSSRYNADEAQMIAGVFKHLVMNGTDPTKITVLTFYNGQRKRIVQELKNTPGLEGVTYFNVFTVDSFQGEENDVILLSLVRSNEHLGIGFLDNKNRLVVALSRARRGLYIFGNAITLSASEANETVGMGRDPLWDPLIQHLKSKGQFKFESGFPVTCLRHGETIQIYEPQQWDAHAGGCHRPCGAVLPCGHLCPYNCHAFPESEAVCRQACPDKLLCGHGCSRFCGELCACDECGPPPPIDDTVDAFGNKKEASQFTASDIRSDPDYEYAVLEAARKSETFSWVKKDRSDGRGGSRKEARSGGEDQFPVLKSHFPALPRAPPANLSRSPSPRDHQAIKAWNAWDAEKADREAAEKARLERAKNPGVDPSKVIYKETYIPTTVNQQGVRVTAAGGPVRTVVKAPPSMANDKAEVPRSSPGKLNPAAQVFILPSKTDEKMSTSNKPTTAKVLVIKSSDPVKKAAKKPAQNVPAHVEVSRAPKTSAKKPSMQPLAPPHRDEDFPESINPNSKPAMPSDKAIVPEARTFEFSIQDLSPLSDKSYTKGNIQTSPTPASRIRKPRISGFGDIEKIAAVAVSPKEEVVQPDLSTGDLIHFNEPSVHVAVDHSLIPLNFVLEDMALQLDDPTFQ